MRESEVLKVVHVYGQAFYQFIKSGGQELTTRVRDEMNFMRLHITSNEELMAALSHVHWSDEKKHQMVDRILKEHFSEPLQTLIHLLITKRRIWLLPDILEWVDDELSHDQGLCVSVVKSAEVMGPALQKEVSAAIAKLLGKELTVRFEVDPSLIGGLYFQGEETVIDYSVRGRLAKLKAQLRGRYLQKHY